MVLSQAHSTFKRKHFCLQLKGNACRGALVALRLWISLFYLLLFFSTCESPRMKFFYIKPHELNVSFIHGHRKKIISNFKSLDTTFVS